MRAVNLLPPDFSRRSVRRRSSRFAWVPTPAGSPLAVLGLLALVLPAILLALAYMRESSTVDERRATLESLQQQLAATPAPARGPAVPATGAQRLAAFSTAAQNRVAFDRVLHDVSRVIPENVWLTSLRASMAATATATATPTGGAPAPVDATTAGFSATGYTRTQKAVARLLSRLELVPGLTNVQLQTSAFTVVSDRRVVEFTVLAQIVPTAAS